MDCTKQSSRDNAGRELKRGVEIVVTKAQATLGKEIVHDAVVGSGILLRESVDQCLLM